MTETIGGASRLLIIGLATVSILVTGADGAGLGNGLRHDQTNGTGSVWRNKDVAPSPSDTQGLSMTSMDFHGALIRGNTEQLDVLMADDFRAFILGGSARNRKQILASPKTKQTFSANVAPALVRGDTATVTGTITLLEDYSTTPQKSGTFSFVDTWRKYGDKWLIASTRITRQVQPPPRKKRHRRQS